MQDSTRMSLQKRTLGRLRGAILRMRIKAAGGSCGSRLIVGPRVAFKYPMGSEISFGDSIEIGSDVVFHVAWNATLSIGNATKITGYCHISASEGISIEANCLIAEYVSIRDSDHGVSADSEISAQAMSMKTVRIGTGSWIGRGAALLKGTSLGSGCVVGANAVVKGVFDQGSIVVGVPARCIKKRQ